MATLNSSIYRNGIEKTFLDESKVFAICLFDSSGTRLASSAAVKYSDDAIDGYVTDTIYWDDNSKQLKVKTLNFDQTKSLVANETPAVQFGIVEVSAVSSEKSEAYPNSGIEYYWPRVFGDVLITGSLANTVNVNENNNFRFDSITVSFSEVDSI